jgi:fumarate reductase subunit C
VSAQAEVRLWAAQRISAMVLGLCVLVHLVTIMVAMRSGLSAAAILERTQGNWAWFLFYVVFVAAVAVHAPVGLRSVLAEWLHWRGLWADGLLILLGAVLLLLGLRAVWAVFA